MVEGTPAELEQRGHDLVEIDGGRVVRGGCKVKVKAKAKAKVKVKVKPKA